jgi:sigma-B regulation protein RsbU (phosphoserine phosphatase)
MRPEVLVCDDQPEVLDAVALLLKGAGIGTEFAGSPGHALHLLSRNAFDLVLADMNYSRDTTSGGEGLDLVDRICRQQKHPPVVVMTAWGDVDLAMEAVRRGASDFVGKPWENTKLLAAVDRAMRRAKSSAFEMDAARQVQERLLPARERRVGHVSFRAFFSPSREVGGDYYDFFEIDRRRFSFLLADVSGKGVPAALMMSNLQALFRAQDRALLSKPAPLIDRVNDLFFRSTSPEHYATLFYAVFDGERSELRYVNCGNPPAIVHRRAGPNETLHSTTGPVGLFAAISGQEESVLLHPGDRLVVCSDGITEADMGEDDRTEIEIELDL